MKRIARIVSALACAVLLCSGTPAEIANAETRTVFTYYLEDGTTPVTELVIEEGETIVLETDGISRSEKGTRLWTSSDETVATVNNGAVTAHAVGTTIIKLYVGDGTKYASAGVKLTVEEAAHGVQTTPVYIGTAKDNIFTELNLEIGDMIDLSFYGVKNWSSKEYKCTWTSTDPDVVYVSNTGLVFAKKPGTASILLDIQHKESGRYLTVYPVDVTVAGVQSSVVTPKPTPEVTPIITPVVTPAVTPVVPEKELEVIILADNCIKVVYPDGMVYVKDKIKVTASKGGHKSDCILDSVEYIEKDAELVIKFQDYLVEGYTYTISDGGELFVDVTAQFSAPDRLEVYYTSLGEEGKAYATDASLYEGDAITTLGYRLFSGDVDVTYTYSLQGYVTYELLNADECEAEFSGTELTFYDAGQNAVIRGEFRYWDKEGRDRSLVSPNVVIRSAEHANYQIMSIQNWALVKTDSTAAINWDNPVQTIPSGTAQAYQLVILFTDNYGYTYSSDERGVNESKGIFSATDYNKPYANHNGMFTYSSSVNNKYSVSEYGEVAAYDKVSNIVVAVFYMNDEGVKRNIGTTAIKIQAPSSPTQLVADKTKVVVSSDAETGMTGVVCTETVKLSLLDQYGDVWKGDYDFDVSCATKEVQEGLFGSTGSPAYIVNDVLYINGAAIRAYTARSSVQFIVTEQISGKTIRINVTIKNPSYSSTGDIVLNGWALDDAKTYDLTLSANGTAHNAFYIDVFNVSNSGVKVGVKTSDIYLSSNSNLKYTTTNCTEGDVYVTITGPDGKVIPTSAATNSGLTMKDGRILFHVVETNADGITMKAVANGIYTVKAVYITKNDGRVVTTAKKSTTFTIKNGSTDIKFDGLNGTLTETAVASVEDAKNVVEELFRFTYKGEEWLDFSVDMITDVDYSVKNGYITIRGLTISVPYDGHTEGSFSYEVTLVNLNQIIRTKAN